ncbi:hypothetical protein SBRY_10857 [Actinacidiphila bryophytorum]|uniref:Uncharacterized protein n=1 Tax=Actinacidiphila bryophytorum TaxID=1436133 RepID=A0A9W4E154_9ACTN|nr:hypothetical protein SBRY_10857 [Actinacidiphila bryophytorum]
MAAQFTGMWNASFGTHPSVNGGLVSTVNPRQEYARPAAVRHGNVVTWDFLRYGDAP